ncbi:TonB-dependent receptor plug domain-containing protein [Flavobacterium sp. ANB]|uniref:TonB-dependent siderophore receptor n=1 Tax=unclassified Flavobacterium TaxID=196869 RepID=UPI0012B74B34|nr:MULTISPECIES: TonB-dependent receptor plug domain-containing protein [unclassified Flavobacterium]MBF4518752.1 TonB-dependent receptor plug domain-containing protein [Flavobacterium sp. ANB]MTD71535.1 TonB-dependent receptor plug domain-containing protein [Flavobacterium sp. LC2016-13]
MKKVIFFSVAVVASLQIYAQKKDSITNKYTLMDEVIIEGVRKSKDVSSELASKLPLKNLENPQVTASVSPQLIKNRNFFTQGEMLKNATGVAPSWAGISPYYSIRGFRTRSSFRNGVNGYVASDMDPVNIAQLEVIKGPSAVIFGGGGATMITFGGLINRVTVKPQQTTFADITVMGGSYNLQRATIDINRPLDKDGKILARLTGAYNYNDTFQDQGFSKTFFLAPSISYKFSDDLKIQLDAEILNKMATNNPLYQVALGTAKSADELNLDYYRSFNDNSVTLNNKAVNIYGKIIYRLSENWKSETNLISINNKTPGDYIRLRLDDNSQNVTRRVYRMYPENITSQQIQQDFVGNFKIGSMKNRLITGVEYYHYLYGIASKSMNFTKVSATASDPQNANFNNEYISGQLATKPYGENYKAIQDHYSVYVSDVINPLENLSVMLSARINYINNKGTEDLLTATTTGDYTQTAVSPKLGINYQIIPERIALFANYMNGFQPQAPQSVNGQMTNFQPVYGNQWESGVKVSLKKNLLDAVLSYYNIDVTNVVRQNPNDTASYLQDGEQRSKGFEADLESNPIKGLFLHAGFAYNDSKLIVSDALTERLRPVDAGPKLSGTWYVNYAPQSIALNGFSLGIGGSHYGKDLMINNTNGSFYTNPYTVINSVLSFEKTGYVFSLSANNLLNEHYWYGGRGMITPGTLRQVILSLKLKL